MTERGVEKVEEIRQDLACPNCEYNLRGLRGDVVVCPECGTRIDVARLISRKWTGPWYSAPGYNQLCVPTAIALGCSILTLAMSEIPMGIAGLVVGLMLWIALMVWATGRFGSIKGFWLALLAHVVLFCYLLGILGGILFLIGNIDSVLSGQWVLILRYCLVLALFALLVLAGQMGERYIARQCIRRYLQRQGCE